MRAERDLIHAEQSLKNAIVINEAIVYHTQQAAEKAVKGYLTARGQTFPKIHDVVRLVTTAATLDRGFAAYFSHAQTLTPYGFDFRYPGGDLEPGNQATHDAVQLAVKSSVTWASPSTGRNRCLWSGSYSMRTSLWCWAPWGRAWRTN